MSTLFLTSCAEMVRPGGLMFIRQPSNQDPEGKGTGHHGAEIRPCAGCRRKPTSMEKPGDGTWTRSR